MGNESSIPAQLDSDLADLKNQRELEEKEAQDALQIEEEDKRKVTEWVQNVHYSSQELKESAEQLRMAFCFLDRKIDSQQDWVLRPLSQEIQLVREEFKSLGTELLKELRAIKAATPTKDTVANSELEEMRQMMNGLRMEIETMKREQQAIQKSMKMELASIRGESKKEIPSSSAPSTSSMKNSKNIKESINGVWKLISSDNMDEYVIRNREFNHEVYPNDLRLTVTGANLVTSILMTEGWKIIKTKTLRAPDDKKNRWYLEGDHLISVDSNGCETFKERCTRYMKNGELVMVNEMGGVKCSRVYKRIC